MVVLIDNVRLRILKATKTVAQAEFWAEILIPQNDFLVTGTDNRSMAAYTKYELRRMYHNHSGIMLAENFDYGKLCNAVGELARNMEEDETSEEELRDMLGRDLQPIDPTPVPRTPGRRLSDAPAKANRPKEGTATGKVWDIADAITEKNGDTASRTEVVEACGKEGINTSTASTQYAKWRKNHLAEESEEQVEEEELEN